MKQILYIIICLITLSACSDKRNGLDELNLKGDVVKYYQTQYEAEEKFGKWELGDKSYYGHSLMIFNDDGFVKEQQSLNKDGSIDMRYVNSFKDGLLSETSSFDENDKLKAKSVYNSSGGKIVSSKEYDEEGKLEREINYNYKGELIASVEILKNGTVTSKFENFFSGDQLDKQIHYDSLGQVSSISKYKRNSNDDISKYQSLDEGGKVDYEVEWEYEYDDKGNWIKQYDKNDGKIENISVRKIIYKEDLNKNWTKNDIVGIWFEINGNTWIELKSDNSYDWGYRENIKDYGKWEMNTENSILTFRSNTPDKSKKFKYQFDELNMVFLTINGRKEMELEKR